MKGRVCMKAREVKRKVMLATPFYDVKGFSPYIESLVNTVKYVERNTTIEIVFVPLSGDSYIDRARNYLAYKFLMSDCDELFFIDSDMAWPVESFLSVVAAEGDIVGVGYPCKNNWDFFGLDLAKDQNQNVIVKKANNLTLLRALNVPTGFCKIRKRVFVRLAKAFSNEWYSDKDLDGTDIVLFNFFGRIPPNGVVEIPHHFWGEDVGFCLRWRSIGGEIWVLPNVDISHIGTNTMTGNYAYELVKQGINVVVSDNGL